MADLIDVAHLIQTLSIKLSTLYMMYLVNQVTPRDKDKYIEDVDRRLKDLSDDVKKLRELHLKGFVNAKLNLPLLDVKTGTVHPFSLELTETAIKPVFSAWLDEDGYNETDVEFDIYDGVFQVSVEGVEPIKIGEIVENVEGDG